MYQKGVPEFRDFQEREIDLVRVESKGVVYRMSPPSPPTHARQMVRLVLVVSETTLLAMG